MSVIFQGNGGIVPTGKKTLNDLQETDVTSYATAQVNPTNIAAQNIKKDVHILGVTGTYEPNLQQKTVEYFPRYDDNQDIEPDAGYDGLTKVIIQKPATLVAENIKNGTLIGNIMGTYGYDATATVSDIAYGKTAYGPVPIGGGSGEIQGTLLDSRGSVISTMGIYADNDYVRLVPEDGLDIIVDGQLGIRASASSVAGYAGLTADVLKAGVAVLGITGTYAPSATEKYSCLITSSNQASANQYVCVSGNDFTDYYSQANNHFSASTLSCKASYGPSGTNHVYFNNVEQTLDANNECRIQLVTDVNITITGTAGDGATITITNV